MFPTPPYWFFIGAQSLYMLGESLGNLRFATKKQQKEKYRALCMHDKTGSMTTSKLEA